MLTIDQINNLKKGDKLIFIQDGGVLSTDKGNVFTFSNHYKSDDPYSKGKYFQCLECLYSGNTVHNFPFFAVELFDENIHKEYRLMTVEKLKKDKNEFINRYGS